MSKSYRDKPPFMSMRWLNLHLRGIIWTIVILFLASCFFMYIGTSRANRRNEERQRAYDEAERAKADKQAESKALPEALKAVENNPVVYVTYPASDSTSQVIDVKSLYKRMMLNGYGQVKNYPDVYRKMAEDNFREQSLKELVTSSLYEKYAQTKNIKPKMTAEQALAREMASQGASRFNNMLRENGITQTEWLKLVNDQLVRSTVLDSVIKPEVTGNVSDEASKAYYDNNKNKFALDDEISFKQLIIGADDFKSKTSVDEAQIKQYFEAHKADFKSGVQYNVSQILVDYRKDSFKDSIEVKDADIAKLYEERKADYVIGEKVKARHILIKPINNEADPFPAAKAKIEEIKKRLDNGEDFAVVAKETSEDSSASDGGNLGTFGRKVMVAPFEEAAFNAKNGEITGPVKTQYGYHLIKVEDKIPASERSLEDVKTELRDEIRNTKAEELARRNLDEAYAAILSGRQRISDFVNFSTAEYSSKNSCHLPVFYEGSVDENYSTEDAKILKAEVCDDSGKVYSQIIDALKSLKKGDVSRVIETSKGLHLLYVEDILEPKPLTALSKDIRDQIRAKLEDEESAKLAKAKVDELAKSMSGKTVAQIAKEFNPELKDNDITFDKVAFSKNTTSGENQMLFNGIGKFSENGRSYLSEVHKQLVDLISNKEFKGKVAGPFETKFGWNFIEVTGYDDGRYESYEEVKNEIAHVMTLAPSEDEISKLYEERKESYKIPASRDVKVIRTKSKKDAEQALKSLNDGDIFAIVAQNCNANGYPTSTTTVRKSSLKEDVANAVWALEAGKYTDVLESNGIFEIYQYNGKEVKEGYKSIGDVISDLRQELSNQYRAEATKLFEKSLFAEAKINRVEQTLKEVK